MQSVIYVDGDFDLFTAGHISFLRTVTASHRQLGGLEAFLVVGLYDDAVVSGCKGSGFPVMNMVERALSVLQCRVSVHKTLLFLCSLLIDSKYVDAVVLSVPLNPTAAFLDILHPPGISALYHGPVTFTHSSGDTDRYASLKDTGLLVEVANHPYKDVTTEAIRQRVLDKREAFESRQRAKAAKKHTNNPSAAERLGSIEAHEAEQCPCWYQGMMVATPVDRK